MTELTSDVLATIAQAEYTDAEHCFDGLSAALDKYEINTVQRVAAFIATVAVESMHLTKFEEGLYYKDPVRVATIFRRVFDTNKNGKIDAQELATAQTYCRNPQALSQKLYGGYHGRGPIQITWLKNYQAYTDDSGNDVVTNPDLLLQMDVGFDSAGWFWYVNGCNAAADKGSMYDVTGIVNGPARLELAQRTSLYNDGLKLLS